ncbi:MAG: PASTA domain-containing protein [Treponema sp.]|jgi:beta-lactam-binding protein with PASTA domain|nr:PASTA domain-containing protein [Treponema sp.]
MAVKDFSLDGMGSHLRLFISLTVGLLVFVGMIALSVFFIAVRGKEQVMVPDIAGKELTQALLELQDKELYPLIDLRITGSAEDKGMVLEQEPEAGTLVKAERRINLVVGAGLALDTVGAYIGRDVNEVRAEIAAVRAQSEQPLLNLKEPFMFQYAPEPAGTVLQQKPQAGTDITGPIVLELVVSRGQENARITVPDITGLGFQEALDKINQTKVNFIFSMRPPAEGEGPGIVVSQNPQGGVEISSSDKLSVTVTSPEAAEGERAGLFSYTLPVNPYPLALTVDAELPGGTRRRLINVNHPGGQFTLPYRLPEGSSLVLFMLGRELHRETIGSSAENPEPGGL